MALTGGGYAGQTEGGANARAKVKARDAVNAKLAPEAPLTTTN